MKKEEGGKVSVQCLLDLSCRKQAALKGSSPRISLATWLTKAHFLIEIEISARTHGCAAAGQVSRKDFASAPCGFALFRRFLVADISLSFDSVIQMRGPDALLYVRPDSRTACANGPSKLNGPSDVVHARYQPFRNGPHCRPHTAARWFPASDWCWRGRPHRLNVLGTAAFESCPFSTEIT